MSDTEEANKKRRDGGDSSVGDEQNRKRLRSATSDLKVIVGTDSGKQEVFWHFSQTLATQSGYVDALLSTPLPTADDASPSQKDYKQIVFSDVTPDQWERMMKFISNPSVLKSMKLEDAFELAELYDRYDFPSGIRICDDLLYKEALTKATVFSSEEDYHQVELCVRAIALSEKINLKKTFHRGREWLQKLLMNLNENSFMISDYLSPDVGFPLTTDHIRQLVPTIVRDFKLEHISYYFQYEVGGTYYGDKFGEEDGLEEHFDGGGEEVSFGLKEEIIQILGSNINDRWDFRNSAASIAMPLFPQLFIMAVEKCWARNATEKAIQHVRVGLSDTAAPDPHSAVGMTGIYSTWKYGHYSMKNAPFSLGIRHRLNQWELTEHHKAIYVCPNSGFSPLPPKTGWVGVADNKKADLKIEYLSGD
jgi:hypothetical protein